MADKSSSFNPPSPPPYDEDDESIEVSQITSYEKLKEKEYFHQLSKKLEKIEKIAVGTRRKVTAIPEIQKAVAELQGLYASLDRRISRVEDRHHDCVQIDAISSLTEELTLQRKDQVDIAHIQEKIIRVDEHDKILKKIANSKNKNILGFVSVIVSNIVIIVSAAWFLSSMNTEIQVLRRDSTKAEMVDGNDICYHMTKDAKESLRKSLSGSNKRLPYLCSQ